MRLVLGSASAGRLSVLRKAGVEPVVLVSDVDEDAIIASLGNPLIENAFVINASCRRTSAGRFVRNARTTLTLVPHSSASA